MVPRRFIDKGCDHDLEMLAQSRCVLLSVTVNFRLPLTWAVLWGPPTLDDQGKPTAPEKFLLAEFKKEGGGSVTYKNKRVTITQRPLPGATQSLSGQTTPVNPDPQNLEMRVDSGSPRTYAVCNDHNRPPQTELPGGGTKSKTNCFKVILNIFSTKKNCSP